MRHGFIKTAAATPDIRVADTEFNAQNIVKCIKEAAGHGAKIIALPELCITGYSCGDLFYQELLLEKAKEALLFIIEETKDEDCLAFVGMPLQKDQKLYNVAAVFSGGALLGFIPKTFLPNQGEFYEMRHFTEAPSYVDVIEFEGLDVPFGTNILFACDEIPNLLAAAEICEDVWAPLPPSTGHALAGATVIVNCSASDETTGKDVYRASLVQGQSARVLCAYLYSSAGEGESTTDVVYSGHNLICENGVILSASTRFRNGIIYGDIDLERLVGERRRMTSFRSQEAGRDGSFPYMKVGFHLKKEETKLERSFYRLPFVPETRQERDKRCEEILSIQSMGLKKRIMHTGCKNLVVGISGGLDSTLALLVSARACDQAGLERSCITAVTMPCFGTTDRTYRNAVDLSKKLGANFLEVDIKEAVTIHFRDIGHAMDVHDVTYENSQARERTQVLMDIANQSGGMVVGTGDMSELALGWATYNGDHMSMYGVNASVPKTLVRHLVQYYADTCDDLTLKAVLNDVLDTPVSPELLPPEDGKISQKTEDLVGPYELHDFFLYYMLRYGYEPEKIFRLARMAFLGEYTDEFILKWMKTFYRRFFSQQFKRSCVPDGPKVGSVALSPRGDLRMPSDACGKLWIRQVEAIQY